MRLRRLLLTGVVASAMVNVPVASAEYPDVCYNGVEGASERALVSFVPSALGAVSAVVSRAGGRMGARAEPLGMHHVELPTTAARDSVVAALRGVAGVRWAEADRVGGIHRTPNDSLAKQQWAIDKISLKRAWDVQTGKSTVVVAVIDTGVAAAHPDLKGQVLAGVDTYNDDDDATDDHGHGTHVAGTVAAASNNRRGVAGVAWGSRILPVKALDADGFGTSCDVAVAMIEAVKREVDVVNMSLGFAGTCPLAFRAAVEYATYKKTLIVASSGNSALQGGPSSAPGNCPAVLGVGATDAKDKPAVFSTFGPQVDVSAPGDGILSTTIDPQTGKFGYGFASGTSMAAPHVAGLAALVYSRHADWTPQQVSDAIMQTTDDKGPRGRDDYYGTGRVNAARLMTR